MRVLIVDESEERATVLREGLLMAGHEVVASLASPLELLRAVEHLQPDVIVIDTESPTRDVLEHRGRLRALRGVPALRKLAMSRKLRLGEVAQQALDPAELLGKS